VGNWQVTGGQQAGNWCFRCPGELLLDCSVLCCSIMEGVAQLYFSEDEIMEGMAQLYFGEDEIMEGVAQLYYYKAE